MRNNGFLLSLVITTLLSCTALSAHGQNYPNKPIRMLAPEAGGVNEVAGRIVSQVVSRNLGQQIVFENRGGASGAIAGEIVATAPPDGYTLLYYGSTIWIVPLLRDKVPFDPLRDFAPISLTATAQYFLFTHASVPAKTLQELIDLCRGNPGKYNYGSAGSGAATHLSAELFKILAHIDITRVAYKGSALAATGVIGGEVHMAFSSGFLFSQVKTGKLRVLAVGAAKRSTLAPDIPTMSEAGVPGYESSSPSGMFAPVKTPKTVINRLNREILRALQTQEVKDRFREAAIEPVGSTPEEFGAIVKAETEKWGKVIKTAGVRE